MSILSEGFELNSETLPLISGMGELIPGGFFIYHAYGSQELIACNRKMWQLFGCDSEEQFRAHVGNSFRGIVHPDDYEATEQSIRAQIATHNDRTDHVVYRFVRRDGSVGVMDDYGHFADSQLFGPLYYVFVQDVSAQYKANQEKRSEELQQLIAGYASSYDIVYLVDMADGSLEVCKMADHMLESTGRFEDFGQARDFTLNRVIHPRDRRRMDREFSFDVIRKKLCDTLSYSTEYCLLKNGSTFWGEMTVTAAGQDRIILSMAERDLEIAKRQLEEKRYGEYMALYAVDIDTRRLRAIKTSPLLGTMRPDESADYVQKMQQFALQCENDAREFFQRIADLDNVCTDFAREDKRTFVYKSDNLLPGSWMEVTSYLLERHEDGTPALFTLGFSRADSFAAERNELQVQLRQNMEMIGGLAEEYYALYYFNIAKDIFSVYSLDEKRFPETAKIVHGKMDPVSTMARFGSSPLVHPDDRARFAGLDAAGVARLLAHSKKHSIRFRRNFGGRYLWCELDLVKYEDVDEPANAIAVGFAQRDADIRNEMVLQSSFSIMNKLLPPDESVNGLLALAGDYYGAERAYLFELDGRRQTTSNTYEWCADGVEAMIDKLQDVPIAAIDGWLLEFRRRGAFFMGSVDDERNSTQGCELLEMQGISRLIAAPILSGQEIVGFVGVDNPTKACDSVMAIESIAAISYGEILRRKEKDEEHVTLQKLTDTFKSVYFVDLSKDYMHNWKIDEFGADAYGGVGKYSDRMGGYVRQYIAQADRDRCLEMTSPAYILEKFRSCDRFSVEMTDIMQGEERNYLFDFVKVSPDGSQLVISCTDVTESVARERKQAKALEEALSMAQSANRAKTTFLNNMSHDIRTPMNAIIGYTGLAASHIDNKQQVQDYLAKIGQSSGHLLSLINDVLDMSRIESGKMNLDEKPENLPELIHMLRDIVQADINAKQHDLFIDTVNVHDERVVCDKLRLNQVLLNILSNAIKYTAPRGTISMRITQLAVKPSGYATYEFCIKDNGMGMSEEFIKTIYDPFTRVKSSTVSGIQGTGLGMAITKNIIDMMGGQIDVQSQLGKGTEITVTFEFKLAGQPQEPVQLEKYKGLRGLIVDDNAETCMSIARMLKDIGMRSLWCTSGKEAVIRARDAYRNNDRYKLYIIDWLMPDMNGIETTRRIRKEIGDDTPIIILTAYDWPDIEQEAREAGVTAFVSKPMFPSDLHRVLAGCMGAEMAAQEPARSGEQLDLAGRKILLVEDNDLNREIATAVLEEYGCRVFTANDGDVAVEKMKAAREGDYDLVLMDIQMPTMDGYEAARQIRALESSVSGIPILAMTANAFEEDRQAALESGMNDHIAKPIDIEKLKITLAKYL